MIKTNLLQGERVSLRAMEPEDLEVLYTLENDTTLWDKFGQRALLTLFAETIYCQRNARHLHRWPAKTDDRIY